MFAAIFSLGSTAPAALTTPVDRLERAINAFEQADVVGSWDGDRARIVQTLTWNTAESKREEVPHACAESGRIIAAWVRLDNRIELLSELSMSREATDPMLVLGAYDRWGDRCVEHLLGDFSFVIHDPADGTVFAARDPMGVRPFYYHAARGAVIVATTAAVFHVIEGLALTPSEGWLARYAVGISQSHTETPWPQVRKLHGGHTLTFRAGEDVGTVESQAYHAFRDDAPVAFTRDETWVTRYRAVLEEAVRCRLRTTFPLGAETTGGIDSSTCVGFAAGLWPGAIDDLHTFGFVHTEHEPEYILETSRLHGIEQNHILQPVRNFDPAEIRQRTLTVLGHPSEHGNAHGHDPLYVLCKEHGVRTLLSGFGGDEAVSNPADLLARELIDHRRFALLYDDLRGPPLLRPLRFVRAIQRHRRGSTMPSELAAAGREYARHFVLRADVLARHGLIERHLDRFRFDEPYRSINGFVLGDRLAMPFVPTRLENCTLMAQARGIEYRWPLLDVRLVQQYLSTPSIEKKRREFGRYLHRRAIDGVVPAKVQWKPSKDMGDPLRDAADRRSADTVAGLLAELHPALASIVDREALTRNDVPDAHHRFRRQVQSLRVLDLWLHRFHP